MKSLPLAALVATAALLSACNSSSDTNTTNAATANDSADAANTTAPSAPIALPPAIANTQSYRCADSSVISVDFMTDGTSAHLHTTPDGSPIDLTAPAAGEAFTGTGYTVSGTGKTITYTAPDKKAQSCKG